jgi:hypothetical protein
MMFTNRFAKMLFLLIFCLAPIGCSKEYTTPEEDIPAPVAPEKVDEESSTPAAPPA